MPNGNYAYELDKLQTIIDTEGIRVISDNKNYGFKLNDIDIYRNEFLKLKENGTILKGDFEDNVWIGKYRNYDKTLKFEFELFKELQLSLKAFVISELKAKICHTVGMELKYIQDVVKETNMYSSDFFEEFEDNFNSKSDRLKKVIAGANLEFLKFFNIENTEEYLNLFENVEHSPDTVRELPDYNSILTFDYVINDYTKNCSKEEKLKYFPILIWWKITKIIPLRPIEFLLLKNNCFIKEENDYFITVPREKKKKRANLIQIEDKLKITEDAYNLLKEYSDMIPEEDKTKYLISYKAYLKFFSKNFQERSLGKKRNLEQMEKDQMRTLFLHFYNKVVNEKYGYTDIKKLNLGDTRHLAFCNMMLQGFNMLSIARMGGHTDLKAQMHYSRHLDTFAEARVNILADAIKRNRDNYNDREVFSDTEALVIRSKVNFDKDSGIKIENGFCDDKQFPSNCIDNCLFCKYFRLDLSNPNIKEKLKNTSNVLKKNIEEQIESIRQVSQNMVYDIQTLTYSYNEQEILNSLSNKLKKEINQKAIVDSYIMEVDKNECKR